MIDQLVNCRDYKLRSSLGDGFILVQALGRITLIKTQASV